MSFLLTGRTGVRVARPVPSITMGIVGIGTLILLTLHSDDTVEAIFR